MTVAFDPTLYVITDSRVARGRDQIDVIGRAIAGGATMVQLRDKDLSAREQYALGVRLRDLTRASNVALICNDRVDLTLALDADGVHLGQDDLPPEVARALLGPHRIIGVSAGTPAEFAAVDITCVDYLGVGPFAATGSKGGAGAAIGSTGIAAVRRLTSLPIVAIGGLHRENAAEAMRAGANGIAAIAAIVGADDPEAVARALRAVVDASRLR
ncbi:MAG: thiamine phosphate synthase [Chloroflexota bacterium]|nr:MAG: thiamine phosphate synthase [Chloroflexota bacterium]